MALTKVTRSGITDNSVNAAKIEDGTVVDADITPGTITPAKLASTLDLSSKTVTLPNTSVTNDMLAGSIANDKLANSSITINGAATALGGSISAGSLAWQSVIVSDGSTVTTMVAGRGYFVNNTSAAGIVKLPAGGTAGDTIAIKDYAGNFATNKLTIQRNGHNIQGVANDGEIKTNRASVVLVYIDATKGWLYTNESNVADLQQALYIEATGGTVTTSGDYKIHSFTGDGNFVVTQLGNAAGGPSVVDYAVVAGGGGGGSSLFGNGMTGGGGGGYRESKSPVAGTYTASPLAATTGITLTTQTYPVTVGAGGTQGTPWQPTGSGPGTDGSPSIFSTITSAGGGVGVGYQASGQPGGSGGGGGDVMCRPGGTGNDPPVSPPQGNNGGNGSSHWAGGGTPNTSMGGSGGGAGGAGSPGIQRSGTLAGGPGTTSSITGSPVTRAAGGRAKAIPRSSPDNLVGPVGGANTGDAGGGENIGGAGGKGIVILRYKYQN
jgi:hypothetical protein